MNIHNNVDEIYSGVATAVRGANSYSSGNTFAQHNEGEDRRRAIIGGLLALLLYFGAFWAVMVLCEFDRPTHDPLDLSSGTILISFGSDSYGAGEAARGGSDKPLLTQNESEVKMLSSEGEQPVERTVNSRALFPGVDSSSHDLSQGSQEATGANSSHQDGQTENEKGNAETLTGNYSLEGRKLIGDLPLPDYETDAHGRVIMNITVDDEGRVTMARLEPVGSTTNNSILIAAARDAALRARFSSSTEFLASGTITYYFRML